MAQTDRSWPLPARNHIMRMRWHDLLFMHYRVQPRQLERHLPTGISLDCFEGDAWVGIVPFRMTGVAPVCLPAVPWLSAFPELNVRTYVSVGGKPGVWFFSLDATNPVAVRAARRIFCLKYMDARIAQHWHHGWCDYRSVRTHRNEPPAELAVRYRGIGAPFEARRGTLEHWLTARYCLYTVNRSGEVLRGEIDHPPWRLQAAELESEHNSMLDQLGIELPSGSPHLLFSEEMAVKAWINEPV